MKKLLTFTIISDIIISSTENIKPGHQAGRKKKKSMSREERTKRVVELLNSYDENIQVAEECGISAEELWNTLYRPHMQAIMDENK